ncbi:MAG: UTP--glucose-1-phosphate uridylyltransferase [Myxococcota bacterium]|nr:UTP--glucose-1-phosphate uridylyltransferase [Myxococcota bacterium]
MRDPRAEAIRAGIGALPPAVRAILDRHGFEMDGFMDLADRWLAGDMDRDARRDPASVRPVPDDSIIRAHREGTPQHAEAVAAGVDAIRRGEVGAVVMNGGMATRFGGVPKGTAEALPGRSFLALKIAQIRALPGAVPMYVMNSFATEEATERHIAGLRPDIPVRCFAQGVGVRLTLDGAVFVDPRDPPATLYAPGHGDLPSAIRSSGLLDGFTAAGGRWLVMSNVDNVGATVDPAIVGQVILSGRRVAAELAERVAGDSGGMPAVVEGRPQILEAFRLPAGFDDSAIRWFNTNTIVVAARIFERPMPLSWFAVRKSIDGRPAIQFERLIGEVTAFEEPLLLGVPRTGPRSRFLPVKTPEDLERLRPAIAAVVGGW